MRLSRLAAACALPLLLTMPARAEVTLTPDKDLLSADDLALRDKIHPFVHCMNTITHNIGLMVRPYHELYAKVSRDPVGASSENNFFWKQYQYSGALFTTVTAFGGGDPVKACAAGLQAAIKLPPPDPVLDKLAASFADDLNHFVVLAPKVEGYYDDHTYRDDKMAQGRAMNAEYDPLLRRLLADIHATFVEVGDRNVALERRRVDSIEAHDGRHLRWEANAFMLQARLTLRGLSALVAARAFSKDAVLAQATPLEQRFDEAKAYAAAHPEEESDKMDLWSRISSYAADFTLAAKEARRDATDQPTLEVLADHVERLNYEFDNMVGDANIAHR